MSAAAKIYGINGPVVTVKNAVGFSMQEMVFVGELRLIGEVIGVESGRTTIQVYEGTTSLRPGEDVTGTGSPISVTLGPGIIGGIFDGIQRPLKKIETRDGYFISRGGLYDPLDTDREWDVKLTVKPGDELRAGQVYAVCTETASVEHRCILAPNLSGNVIFAAADGKYTRGHRAEQNRLYHQGYT